MGNICRSPTAEGVFRKLSNQHFSSEQLHIDSCGTIGYHQGESPDTRSVKAAENRGYDLSQLKARKFNSKDFEFFDFILVMDNDNKKNLFELADNNQSYLNKIQLFLDFAKNSNTKIVPDPYYGGAGGFDHVIDLIEDASRGLISHLKQGI